VTERLPGLLPGQLDAAQHALYSAIAGSPRVASPGRAPLRDEQGRLAGPFNALLYSPRIGDAVQQLGTAVRYGSALTPRAKELAILEVAWYHNSDYEWATHVVAGQDAGLSSEEIAAIRAGSDAATFEPGERAVCRAVRSLLRDRDLPDPVYDQARDILGEPVLVELIVLVGYYELLALLLRVARTRAPSAAPGGLT